MQTAERGSTPINGRLVPADKMWLRGGAGRFADLLPPSARKQNRRGQGAKREKRQRKREGARERQREREETGACEM